MVFSSSEFLLLFFPITLVIYYAVGKRNITIKNIVLLGASLLFYAWGEPVFVFIMVGEIIINWLIVLVMSKQSGMFKKVLCIVAVCLDVSVLFIFKYMTFITTNLAVLLKNDTVTVNIALPIGISFFSFQILSYLLDVYYCKSKPQKNLFKVMLYISFFPQLIAGPIVRYSTIAEQIDKREGSYSDVAKGMQRFIIGLGKKVLLSNYLAVIADNIFNVYAKGCAVMTIWLGAIAYSLQIYFDFSGYSDMAIGLGKMFGFTFQENFNHPYAAGSVTDFWRRWHISLVDWFRDYVYIPLGGNRVSRGKWIRNLFIVWLLTGIWHGANWTFLLWGMFFFVVLLLEKTTGYAKKLGWISHIYTLFVIGLTMVIFRSDSIGDAIKNMGMMFGINSTGFIDEIFTTYLVGGGTVLLFGIILSTPVLYRLWKKLAQIKPFQKGWRRFLVPVFTYTACIAVFVLSIFVIVGESYNPFIYFNF